MKQAITLNNSTSRFEFCSPGTQKRIGKAAFPSIFGKWIDKINSLDNLPRMKQSQKTFWFYAEDAQGDKLNFNFKECSAQIKLIDEMDLQCNYICDSLIELVIKPLLSN